jgi:hypothetical protein
VKKSFVVSLVVVLVSLGCSAEKESEITPSQAAVPAVNASVEATVPASAPVAPPPGSESADGAAVTPVATSAAAGASAEEVAANPKKYIAPAAQRDYGTDGKPNLGNLTEAVRDWVSLTGEIPGDIKDVNDGRYLRFPQPPAGQKYVLNKDTRSVTLANQ